MLRVCLAVLILIGQAAAPGRSHAVLKPAAAGWMALLASQTTICHAEDNRDGPAPSAPAPSEHTHDCALCVAGFQTGASVLVPESAALLPGFRAARAAEPILTPPSTGPPRAARRTARPRAPPVPSL